MQVWVDYDGLTSNRCDDGSFNEDKPRKPLVSTVRDLSSVLLQDMFVGFSSSTGSVMSDHFVLGWSFQVKGKLHRWPYRNFRIPRKFAEELEDWETEFAKIRLKFKDLYYATKGFKEKGLLGSGGFGSVYKDREYWSDESPELSPSLGLLPPENELLLVYDYMPNGSLDKYLYNSPEVTLDWKQRFKVIKGVASALFFLHEEWEQVVIHRDIKASNVLLDAELNGRLGDFGLARLCGHGSDPLTTHVAGTWGYLAPDHIRTGRPRPQPMFLRLGCSYLKCVR
ncbi:unnamed protein product [Microthlaspi erraticum]|uniref:Protein kinase domain-containing protein n=1 Tax=Microthlaspi erraticum TaxID=1685480 RepID=A0A6D2IWZ0_9BRAS|nr:unnamed protein product [Microthlaspi erraticum]